MELAVAETVKNLIVVASERLHRVECPCAEYPHPAGASPAWGSPSAIASTSTWFERALISR